jgi:RNA polymerase sigma factor (TIGR02999 family)
MRRAAGRLLRAERRDHTLVPTELVHEAWLRMERDAARSGASRVTAARAMREVLVDHARRRAAAKRDAGRRADGLDPDRIALERDEYVVALDQALAELEAVDTELAAVVELRFFGGLDVPETATALALSPRTVKRRWQLAKAWLHREIAGR